MVKKICPKTDQKHTKKSGSRMGQMPYSVKEISFFCSGKDKTFAYARLKEVSLFFDPFHRRPP